MSLEEATGGSAPHVMSVDLPRGRVRPQHAGSLDERSPLSARDSYDLTSVRPTHMNGRPSSCRPLLWAATTAQMRVLRGQTLLTRTYAAVMPLLDMRWPRCTAHTSMRRDRWRLFMRATRALLGRLRPLAAGQLGHLRNLLMHSARPPIPSRRPSPALSRTHCKITHVVTHVVTTVSLSNWGVINYSLLMTPPRAITHVSNSEFRDAKRDSQIESDADSQEERVTTIESAHGGVCIDHTTAHVCTYATRSEPQRSTVHCLVPQCVARGCWAQRCGAHRAGPRRQGHQACRQTSQAPTSERGADEEVPTRRCQRARRGRAARRRGWRRRGGAGERAAAVAHQVERLRTTRARVSRAGVGG